MPPRKGIIDWRLVAIDPSVRKWSLLMYGLYADESYIDKGGDFVVAGYLLGSKRYEAFVKAWSDALGPLEYFHMSEGHHKKYPEIYKKLLALLSSDYFVAGFAASVNQSEFRDVCRQKWQGKPVKYWTGDHYSYCAMALAVHANRWLDANNPGERHLAYMFEAGYETAGDADRNFQVINRDPAYANFKRKIRYFSHGFMDGKCREGSAVQAADMVAWHLMKYNFQRLRPPSEVRDALGSGVKIYSDHHAADVILRNLRGHVEFLDFYRHFKHAKKLRF